MKVGILGTGDVGRALGKGFAALGHEVVKAFNTVGHAHMFRPAFPGGPPDMVFCGNDDGAKSRRPRRDRVVAPPRADVPGVGAPRRA